MNDETSIVLHAIHDELRKQDAHATGQIAMDTEGVSLFDGKIRLTAAIHSDPGTHPSVAHCHVIAEVGIGDQRPCLESCVVGIDPDRREALEAAARSWTAAVAGPVLSLLHAQPVLGAAHFDGSEPWSVAGCHGFSGPMILRLFEKPFDPTPLRNAAIFDYVAEMAPPGLVHIAKVTLEANGEKGWQRNIEVDGHSAVHMENPWEPGLPAPSRGVISQYAVFHLGEHPESIKARQQIDDAIRQFVASFRGSNDTDKAADALESAGFDAELAHRVAIFVPLAFARALLGSIGASYSPDFARMTKDGRIEEGLRLMRQPVFARASVLCHEMMTPPLLDACRNLAMTSPETNAINSALLAGSRPENLKLVPSLVPDLGIGPEAIEQALIQWQQRLGHMQAPKPQAPPKPAKPWWRFW